MTDAKSRVMEFGGGIALGWNNLCEEQKNGYKIHGGARAYVLDRIYDLAKQGLLSPGDREDVLEVAMDAITTMYWLDDLVDTEGDIEESEPSSGREEMIANSIVTKWELACDVGVKDYRAFIDARLNELEKNGCINLSERCRIHEIAVELIEHSIEEGSEPSIEGVSEADYKKDFINMSLGEILLKCSEISPIGGTFVTWARKHRDGSITYSCGMRNHDKSQMLCHEYGIKVKSHKSSYAAARDTLKQLYELKNKMTIEDAKEIVDRYIERENQLEHPQDLRILKGIVDDGKYHVMLCCIPDELEAKYFKWGGDPVIDTSAWHKPFRGVGSDFESAYVDLAQRIKKAMEC